MKKEKYQDYIELMIQWYGAVNSTHLKNHFSISSKVAKNHLKAYCEQYPKNIKYNSSSKAFLPLTTFASLSKTSFEAYLHTCDSSIYSMTPSARYFLEPEKVHGIIQAILEKKRIDIGYASLNSPDDDSRIISPHHLVYDGRRWHVRAYCEKNQDFRDFVLNRFSGEFAFEGKTTHLMEDDKKWVNYETIEIEPDPRLPKAQQRIVALDYQMDLVPTLERYRCQIRLRKALVFYFLNQHRLSSSADKPENQQIQLTAESYQVAKQYLVR